MKLLSKSAWRNIQRAVSSVFPGLTSHSRARRGAGEFAVEQMETRQLLSVGLDPSFGTGGIVTMDFGGGDAGQAVAMQGNKVIMAGRAYNGNDYDFGLVRFNADGSIDHSFGNDGFVLTDMGSMYDTPYGMAVGADGRIVVVGQVEGATIDFGVARYTADGMLDTTFGDGGKVITDFDNNYDVAYSVAITSDNKVVVAGTATVGGFEFGIVRYNENGSLDTSFSEDGKYTSSFVDTDAEAYAVLVQPDGKIVAGGYTFNYDIYESDFALMRFNVDGTLDTTFASGGISINHLGIADDLIRALAFAPGGKIVAAGTGNGDFTVARFNANGMIDTSFGGTGHVLVDFGSGYDTVHSVVVRGNKIFMVGTADFAGELDMGFVELNADGSRDLAFAPEGKFALDLGSWDDEAMGVTMDADGHVYVAGWTVNDGGMGDYDMALVHYLMPPMNIDPVANAGGSYSVSEGGSVSLLGSGSYDEDGSIVSYQWDLNYDGVNFSADATGLEVSFSALGLDGPMTRMIALRVVDDQGASSMATAMVSVTNLNPTVVLGEDRSVNEGSLVNLGSLVSDYAGDTLTYAWHIVASNGQVIADSSSLSRSFTAMDNGVYTITLTVTDDDGGMGSDSMVVTVHNVAPTVDGGDNKTINEGGSVSFGGSFSDPGNDSYNVLWHVVASNGQVIADGHGSSFGFAGLDNGTYTVTYKVTDDDGGMGTDTMVVTVNNVAPTVNGGEDKSVNEGSLVSLSAVGSDVAADTITYKWHVVASNGQTIADVTGANFNFKPCDNGVYTVTVKAMDEDGGMTMDTVMVNVANVGPSVSLSGPTTSVRGMSRAYTAAFTDPGSADTHQIMWDFGDGDVVSWHSTKDAGALSVNHSWKKKGTYVVNMSIRDDDGAISTISQVMDIKNKLDDPSTGTMVIGGSLKNMLMMFQPGTQKSTVLIGVDGKMMGIFSDFKKIVAYDSDGKDRVELDIDGPRGGQLHTSDGGHDSFNDKDVKKDDKGGKK